MEKFDLRFRIVEEVSAVVRRVAKRCCNRRAGHCVLGPQHYSTAPDALFACEHPCLDVWSTSRLKDGGRRRLR